MPFRKKASKNFCFTICTSRYGSIRFCISWIKLNTKEDNNNNHDIKLKRFQMTWAKPVDSVTNAYCSYSLKRSDVMAYPRCKAFVFIYFLILCGSKTVGLCRDSQTNWCLNEWDSRCEKERNRDGAGELISVQKNICEISARKHQIGVNRQ